MKMPRKIAITFFATLLLCIPVSEVAHAYSLIPYRMNSQIWYQATVEFTQATRDGIRQAMRNWNAYLPEYRRVCYDPLPFNYFGNAYDLQDGNNFICKQPVGAGGYVGENSAWYSYNSSLGYYVLSESDINLNSSKSWTNGYLIGHFDSSSVAMHELGHTVGLDHSAYLSAIMYESIGTNMVKMTLTIDDIGGVNARYQ